MDRPSRSEIDVLVVGAGPTGLVMASELAARGVSGRIIDRAPVRSERSRALVVQARSLELLQKMGVADELVARGRRTIKATPFVEGRPAANLEFGDIGVDDTPYPFLLFVSQAETERVLEKHLESLGAKVERPVELLSFEGDAEGVSARLRHGDGRQETARVRYLVGADGAHSTVRHTLGLSFKGDAYPQDFVLADTEIDWSGEDDRLYFFLSRKGLIAVFPLAGPSTYRLIATRAEDAPLDAGDPTLEEVQQLATELCPLPVRLYDPSWLARFRLHHRGVDSYRAGQAFVAGDAAHIHSPAGGQGMNTGIQDSYNLAWKLTLVIKGHAPDSILDSYHEERHPIGQRLLRTTDRMFNVAATHNPLAIELRNFLMPRVLPRVMGKRSLRARAFRFVSQLGIRYPDSPIVGEELDGADRAFRRGPSRPRWPATPSRWWPPSLIVLPSAGNPASPAALRSSEFDRGRVGRVRHRAARPARGVRGFARAAPDPRPGARSDRGRSPSVRRPVGARLRAVRAEGGWSLPDPARWLRRLPRTRNGPPNDSSLPPENVYLTCPPRDPAKLTKKGASCGCSFNSSFSAGLSV